MSDSQSEWQAWLDSLDTPRRAASESLRGQFDAFGAADAVGWVKSEICETNLNLPGSCCCEACGAAQSAAGPIQAHSINFRLHSDSLLLGRTEMISFVWLALSRMRQFSQRSTNSMPAAM